MEGNRTRLGLGIALIVVATLGLAAFGTTLLLRNRGGDVANDPAYVAAMSYAGPRTDVAESTRSAGTEPARGHSLAVVTVEPQDATAVAVAGSSEADVAAAEQPETAASAGPSVEPQPLPEDDGAPTIDDFNKETLEESAPFDEAKGDMPQVEDGGSVGGVVGWFEPPAAPETPQGVRSDASLLTPPDLGTETKDGNGTFRESIEVTDSDGDGHPEYVRYRSLLLCLQDEDADGNPEYTLAVGRDAELWDDDEDGTFNKLEGRQAARETADPNDDGTSEYLAQGVWTLSVVDDTEDEVFEHILLTFGGEQILDANQNGVVEFYRAAAVRLEAFDATSNGIFESLSLEGAVFQTADEGDDGPRGYVGVLVLNASTGDA